MLSAPAEVCRLALVYVSPGWVLVIVGPCRAVGLGTNPCAEDIPEGEGRGQSFSALGYA